MWIAKKGTGRNVQQKESGWVRAESAKHGEQYVVGSCEYRRLQRCAPYGIYTKPPKGTPVLVLGPQGGEVCLGAVSDPSAEEELLQEGEILIRSAGGASIRLCKDGRLLLTFSETDFARLSALCGDSEFKGRLLLNAGSTPYLSLRLNKGEKAMEMAQTLVDKYAATAK